MGTIIQSFFVLLGGVLPKLIEAWTKKQAPAQPVVKTIPRIDPAQYQVMLKKEAERAGVMPYDYVPEVEYTKPYGFTPVINPQTGAKTTYCNLFIRTVCRWFGWVQFNTPDKDQASEITRFMRSHPECWKKLEGPWQYQGKTGVGPDYEQATTLACQGFLVIAAQEGTPHGHVNIIAPEQPTIFSPSWGRPVSIVANVGSANWYGKKISEAFKKEPELFQYLGV